LSEQTCSPLPETSRLFEDYYPRLNGYIRSMVRDAAVADDLTQETFVRVHRKVESVREAGAVSTWLFRVATHVALDWLRQTKRQGAHESGVDLGEVEPLDETRPSLEHTIERREMSACMQRYLNQLSDSYRAVIILHDLHGLSAPEIAALLGISLASTKIRLHRARTRLRALLDTG